SHGVPLCFFGEKKRTRTGSWPLLSYAPWVLQLLSEFATPKMRMEATATLEKTNKEARRSIHNPLSTAF
ncbi:hypothetical protein ACUNEX_13710, partial [Serratia sp. IR-2025]